MHQHKRKQVTNSQLLGIGIDLLSLKRARGLIKVHGRSFFDRILSRAEKRKKLKCSSVELAKYFTAKEAFFKASGLSWTDLKGFEGIWIHKIRGKYFEMRCFDDSIHAKGNFFKTGDVWGAKVISWKN